MTVDDRYELGHLLGEFGWNKDRARGVLGIWIFLFLASLVLSLFLIGIPILILSIYYIYRSINRLISKQPTLLVYQQGAIDNRKVTAPKIIRYEEIKNLYLSVKSYSGVINYIITLETRSGKKIKFDEHVSNDIDGFRKLLEEQLVQQQLPEAIAAIDRGESISFSALQVSQAGLSAGKRSLPWSEFGRAEVQQVSKMVFLIVFTQEDREYFAIVRDYVPNIALFFVLIDYIQKTQKI